VYFCDREVPDLRRLSQLDKREIKVGARVASDEYAKGDPSDFALWRKPTPKTSRRCAWMRRSAAAGPGGTSSAPRCRLRNRQVLRVQTLDIHAGGIDLIFPHHENEIAQSEGATGQPFARHWCTANSSTCAARRCRSATATFHRADLREQGVDAAAVRLLFFQTHYRQPIDFTDEALDAAKEGVRRLGSFMSE